MINGKRITLVVPCRNEEKIIAAFLRKVPRCVDEILIVDNNSNDKTAEVAQKTSTRVRIIHENRTQNGIGYGYAHMAGLADATGDYIVAMDGDDTYPLNAIKIVVRKMQSEHWNFISCNRLPLRNPKAISKTRQLGIKILNTEISLLYGYPIKDILTGMWVVQKEVVHELNLTEGDWNLSPEIKLAALANPRIRFTEYHIHHFEREYEPSKQQIFKTGFAHLAYIAKRRLTNDNELYQKVKSLWYETLGKRKLIRADARYAFK
ncbi:MAG: glycosyltransferase family 2 protein [Patescibacteria group bacterium]